MEQYMKINQEKCKKCLSCVEVCPIKACALRENGNVEIDENVCLGCGCCAAACPNQAIEFE